MLISYRSQKIIYLENSNSKYEYIGQFEIMKSDAGYQKFELKGFIICYYSQTSKRMFLNKNQTHFGNICTVN